MKQYEKAKLKIIELPEEQQEIAISLLADIAYWESKVEELQKCPTFQVDPKNPLRQRKLPAHDMLKEANQQKINAQRTLIQIFNKQRLLSEDDPLDKLLAKYE